MVMEACASAHHWARQARDLGHEVALIPPIYVKPFVKRQKNDATDAEAITEAASRPTMRFVEVKSEEKQALGMAFKTRSLLVRQRTQTINALRGHLAEFGIVAPKGRQCLSQLRAAIDDPETALPVEVIDLAGTLLADIDRFNDRIAALTKRIHARANEEETASRLQTIPGVGPLGAAAVTAFAPSMETFRCGRGFAAWLGFVPRQYSTGGKERLGSISKAGQKDIRQAFIVGAMAVVRWAANHGTDDPWLTRMLARKPRKVVAMALANKMARITWALMTKGGIYRAPAGAGVA